MTIDHTDYDTRPEDDYLAHFPPLIKLPETADKSRAYSILMGRMKRDPECHQLGCRFDELPHAI